MSELESFRQQWISDLQSRTNRHAESSSISRPASKQNAPPSPTLSRRPLAAIEDDDGDYVQARPFDGPAEPSASVQATEDPAASPVKRELVSALDHYEEAMEKESQGNMGESLKLYRKAYRLDNRVDRRYREKHFPGGFPAPKAGEASSSTSATATATTSSTQKPINANANANAAPDTQPLTIEELIASFSTLQVEPAPPAIEGTPPPPCPIAALPDELLVHILKDVCVADVGDLARSALVCKGFAYLVATEQRLWRRVCLGSEFGFSALPRHWQRGIEWEPLEGQEKGEEVEAAEATEGGLLVSIQELEQRRRAEAVLLTKSLLSPSVYPSWKHMFRNRPRIRFNGCYISTVNYIRSGQASTNHVTWGGSPVLIVTYYRFLRFFRDGTAISLLTTAAPADVVRHLTPELLLLHRSAAHHHAHLPSALMHQALRGRWRQSSVLDHPDGASPRDHEADLYVETEGVGPKYMYRMDLSLRSAGKTTRNNKIVWRGFYSYNKLTADWAEFQLRNDQPFFFSRVKSYGVGEP